VHYGSLNWYQCKSHYGLKWKGQFFRLEKYVSKLVASTMFAVNLDTSSGTPLFQQVYEQIRNGILAGRLRAGARLPPSRTLAENLGMSRTTVLNALDQLRAEGYLRGKIGSGTFVLPMLPEVTMRAGQPRRSTRQSVPYRRRLIGRIERRWPDPIGMGSSPSRPLRPGNPDLNGFPRELWAKLTAKHWRNVDPSLLGYGDSRGYLPLREAIADYVSRVRGVRCDVERVLVVGGSQQALYLCAQVFERDDVVWVENPGYHGIRAALVGVQEREFYRGR
jgi:GntR family transcriptional regulator / MocR family aminotransferase